MSIYSMVYQRLIHLTTRLSPLMFVLLMIGAGGCAPKVPWDGAEPVTQREKATMETCDCLYTFMNDAAGVDMEHLMSIAPKFKKDQQKVVEDKMTIPEFQEKWEFELEEIVKGQKQMEIFAATPCGKNALENSPSEVEEQEVASAYFRDHCRYLFLFETKF